MTKIWVAIGIIILCITHFAAYKYGVYQEQAKAAKIAASEQSKRDALQTKLNASDLKLAESQNKASEIRTQLITKQEVVYRDRIKTVTVRDCVADSGLFQLYNATLGITDDQQ